MTERSIHVLQMGKHFLYLPIYYAAHKDCFGYLPMGVTVVIDEPVAEHTDTATYDQMMDESSDYRDFEMAITDPTQILRTPITSTRLPAVLATIATNGAFWAVNHGTYEIVGLSGLGVFDKIFAYDKGTTSYSIAARIARDSGKKEPLSDFIHVVAPGRELLLLSDPMAGANAVALSPDILRIEEMTHREKHKETPKSERFSIDLPIGDTDEYNDVVVATLVSSNTFVVDNPEIVQGVVKGIQHALKLIHKNDTDVLRFARSYFRYSDRAQGALNKAIKAGVIPQHVSVPLSHWRCAAKAAFESKGGTPAWTLADQENALRYYNACIRPYAMFSEEAEKVEIVQPPLPRRMSIWSMVGLFALILVTIVTTSYLGKIPTSILAIASFGGLGVAWLIKRIRKFKIYTLIACWALAAISAALPFSGHFGLRDKKIEFLSLAVAIFITAVFETFNYVEGKK